MSFPLFVIPECLNRESMFPRRKVYRLDSRFRGNDGFILVEASVAYMVLSLALVSLLPLFILSIRANKYTEIVKVSTQLSVELLEEIRLRRWDEGTPLRAKVIPSGAALGLDADEISGDKRTFDDIDDFNGWTESAVVDPVMRPIPEFAAYNRSVEVTYVDANMKPVQEPTDFKQVRVCAKGRERDPLCIGTLFTNR